jgi:hypothetical protein
VSDREREREREVDAATTMISHLALGDAGNGSNVEPV